ncbi:MAG: DUF4402 domain-containing protein [Hydrogenovibrio sp.]
MAGDITIEEPLNFGRIAIKDNNSLQTLRIRTNGHINKTDGIIVLEPGQPGRYFLYNFPANTTLDIQVLQPAVSTGFSGSSPLQATFILLPQLELSQYTTNLLGEVTLPLGGELTTSGDGQPYSEGNYSDTYNLLINY